MKAFGPVDKVSVSFGKAGSLPRPATISLRGSGTCETKTLALVFLPGCRCVQNSRITTPLRPPAVSLLYLMGKGEYPKSLLGGGII